jgi:hypothetical protein
MKSDAPKQPALDEPWFFPWWLAALVLVMCGSFFVWGYYFAWTTMDDSETTIVFTQVRGPLSRACEMYRDKRGRFPDNLEVLLKKDALGGPYLESDDALIDSWGQKYQYEPMGPRNKGARPDIWTVAPNGTEIGNWPKGH